MTQSSKAYVLAPVIYVGVIFGLLFLQFSGGERLSRSIGPLTFQATRGVVGDDGVPDVREVSLSFDGLSFRFGETNGLIVETVNNVTDMQVVGYEVRENGFQLRFDGDYRLSFVTIADPVAELQIRLELPEEPVELRGVSIPFTLDGTPAEGTTPLATFVTIVSGDQEYYFTVPPRASIDLQNRKIVLLPEAAEQTIRYAAVEEGDPGRVVRWFDDESLAIGEAEYDAAIRTWVDAAYRGWSSGRLNTTRLTWNGPGGFAAFSEEALAAYLAEAWVRNDYDRVYAEMRRASDLHPGELTLLSAPFMGNLRQVRERYLEDDRTRGELLAEQLDAGDTTLFRQNALYLFASDRGSEELYTELVRFTERVDLRTLDLVSAIGLLRNLFLSPVPDDRAGSLRGRMDDLIRTRLLGAVVRTDEGFFVQTAPGQVDLHVSTIAGAALDAYGRTREDPTIATIGRNLVVSALRQADQNAMIPASLLIRGDTVGTADGRVAPETLYPILADSDAYPHQVSFYREIGSGHWAWAVVDVSPTRITETEWRFELTYPRLRTHFLIIQGVPVFERMELFGQTWRNAPDFEIYSKGRHYDEESNTLMIKYYDDSVRREIALFY